MSCHVHQVGGIVHRPGRSEHVVCVYMHFPGKAHTSIIHTAVAHMGSPCACSEECRALGRRQSSGYVRLLIIAIRGEASRCLRLRSDRAWSKVLLDNHAIGSDTTSNPVKYIGSSMSQSAYLHNYI